MRHDLMPGLSAKVGVISVARATNALAIVVTSAVLARHLDPAQYGTFQQAWLVITVGATVLLSGIPLSVSFFAPREHAAGRRGFLNLVLLALAALGAIGAAGLMIAAGWLARLMNNPDLARYIPALAVYILAILPANPLESFLVVENRHTRLGWITLVASLAMIAAAVLPAMLGTDPIWIYRGLAAYALFRSTMLFAAVAREYRGVVPTLRATLPREFLIYSLPLGANEVVRVSSGWLDKALVASRFDPETFAIFANGAFEIPFIAILLASTTTILMPEFSRLAAATDKSPLVRLWQRAILRTGLFVLPLCAFALLMASDIMITLFSERYAASATPFRVYLLLLPLRCAAYTPMLLALGRGRAVLLGATADLVLSLCLALVLIPRIGYVGPAVALVVSTYAQSAFYLAIAGRALGTKPGALIPWGGLARVGGCAALAAIATAPLLLAKISSPVSVGIAACVFSAAFLAGARAGLLPAEEREFLMRLTTPRKARRTDGGATD
ncbi:MAG: lipopolysaccharide biosynthesis protein [bacterium]